MEPFDGMMILTKKGEKTVYFPFSFIVLENVTSVGGELRKKTWFFNLPVARTWLHAYVCKAERRKLAEYDVRTIVLGRESPPQLELRWFRRRKL